MARIAARQRWTSDAVSRSLPIGLGLALLFLEPALASRSIPRLGAPGVLEPQTGSLLVDYYDAFRRDEDSDAFRRNVSSRYSEATLARLIQSSELKVRRASVVALGLFGGFASNAAVARGLRDPDPMIRALANQALWAIWFRADNSENNQALERVATLINLRRLRDAIDEADRLIARSPGFAEAYNQRAIAHFFQGRFAESVEDCKLVLERNPYHTGALSGMGQGLLRLGRRDEAIQTFRRALQIQPYNDALRESIAELEAGDR